MRNPFIKLDNKGSNSQLLPNQHTLNTLVKGDPVQRSLGNYAKVTPSGESALDSPDIMDMNTVKI